LKVAKTRHFRKENRPIKLSVSKERPRYRLADLMEQMPPGPIKLDEELRAWERMVPVGREFGADSVEQMSAFMQERVKSATVLDTSTKSLIEDGRE